MFVIGSQWPISFEESKIESNILDTDTLRVIALSDDPLLQNKLKENVELAEAATRALEHVYEEEPPPPPPPAPPVEQVPQSNINGETTITTTTPSSSSDNTHVPITNGTGPSSSSPATPSNEHPSTTSSPTNGISTNTNELLLSSIVQPPPPPPPLPPPSSSSASTSPNTVAPAAAVATTLPLGHSAATLQAVYRQGGLLGALPTGNVMRTASGGLYAVGGLPNGLGGQVIYGGNKIF